MVRMEKGHKLNQLLFMDDLKLFSKSEVQIETLVETVLAFSIDIGMEFGLTKCGDLAMTRGKIVKCDGISFHFISFILKFFKEGNPSSKMLVFKGPSN